MGKRVVWFSRHKPTERQMAELAKWFPACTLRVDRGVFAGADDIVQRFREVGGDEMVLVAPLTVIHEIVKRGIKPLKAVMQQVRPRAPDAEVRVSGRYYRFTGYERIESITVQTSSISTHPAPLGPVCPSNPASTK